MALSARTEVSSDIVKKPSFPALFVEQNIVIHPEVSYISLWYHDKMMTIMFASIILVS